MSAWDSIRPTIPPTAPDFEKPMVDPPARPVDIPVEEGDDNG